MNKQKKLDSKLSILIVSSLYFGIILAIIVKAQPVPHNIAGRVFTNDTNGVQNGIPILINNTATGEVTLTQVFAPPIPQLRGSYSATITGTDGDGIYAKAWNDTHWGENQTTLNSGTTFLNIILNITRDSEGNVTILSPQNHTIVNQSVPFNVTANITMLGATGIECNATISFSNSSVLNISESESLVREFAVFPINEHRMVNWSVEGIAVGSSNISVDISCTTDGIEIYALSNASISNITVQNIPPTITEIAIPDPFDLIPGENNTLYCNATVFDVNGRDDIIEVNATLFQPSIGMNAPDDNNNHYTNTSCINVSSSGSQTVFACGFTTTYYANNGTWECNVSVEDSSNEPIFNTTTTVINELLAITIEPNVVDYGELAVSAISPDDVNVTVSNIGNMNFNISVHGYARTEGDNISMACEKGNVSHAYQRYMVDPGINYNQMYNLTNETAPIENITFPQRTDDLLRGNDTNKTYWKMQVPTVVSGSCNGSLVFRTKI